MTDTGDRQYGETVLRLPPESVRALSEIAETEGTDMAAALQRTVADAATDLGCGDPPEEVRTLDASGMEIVIIGRERHEINRMKMEDRVTRHDTWIDDIQSDNVSVHLEQMNGDLYFLRVGQLEFDIHGKGIHCLAR